MVTGVTEIAHITTKQDMSRWCRAHADEPGIHWSVFPGPNGTMIIVEHAEDRCSMEPDSVFSPGSVSAEQVSPDVVSFETAVSAAPPIGVASIDSVGASA